MLAFRACHLGRTQLLSCRPRTCSLTRTRCTSASVTENGTGSALITLPAPGIFQEKRRWIFFTDLHVRKSTLQTCVHVLRFVHKEAVKRDAGVAFLGDFWHIRGDIPIEPLNSVLDEFAQWTQVGCVHMLFKQVSGLMYKTTSNTASGNDSGKPRSSVPRWGSSRAACHREDSR